jgi:signal transduction histidine kinase/DNA-binding response OmpR family regulator
MPQILRNAHWPGNGLPHGRDVNYLPAFVTSFRGLVKARKDLGIIQMAVMRPPFRSWRRPPTIRQTLIWMVVACVLPGWVGMAALFQNVYAGERERAVQTTILTARALVTAVDRDLAQTMTTLEVLATSTKLPSGDFASFHHKASSLVQGLSGVNIVLSDESGQQIVNTLVPFGEPLPPHGNPENLRRVFATGMPVISDLFYGPVAKKHLVAVEVPVVHDGKIKYGLAMGLIPERLDEILKRQQLPPGWIAAIFDASGNIVARTHKPSEFVGHRGAPALVDMMARQTSGFVETRTLEGIPVYSAFSRSEVSNWAVAIGVPSAEMNGNLGKFLVLSCIGGILVLITGIGLAGYHSKRISSAVQDLVAPATAVGRGEVPVIPHSNIREIDEVAHGIDEAFHVLQRRTDERDSVAREKDAVEIAARIKSEFIGTVSHELRTPLTAIAASLRLLEASKDGARSAATDRLISIAHANSLRLVRLVNDILDVEKLDAGKVVFDMRRVDIRSLLEQAIEAHRALAENCGANLRLQCASMHDVRADPDRLMQVASNLLSNAIKFSPSAAEVVVTGEDCGDKVRISVRDHGPGIPENFRGRIFEKFAQADTSAARRKTGTGLGLSIAQEIVKRLGGNIGFEAAPGGGTVFFVDLPRLERLDRVDGSPRLLLCERDASVADTMCERFREAGFAVDCSQTAGEAVSRAQAADYAGILVDMNLSDGDGVSLIQELRELPQHGDTPIIIVSANPGRGRRDLRSSSLNILDWIAGPFDEHHLMERITKAMRRVAHRPARVLHLDDDPLTLFVVAKALDADAIVVSATTLEAARQALAAGDLDLAIVDLELNGSSGADLLPDLHDSAGQPIPAVVYSMSEAKAARADEVRTALAKSRNSVDDLIAVLRTCMAGSRSRRSDQEEAA